MVGPVASTLLQSVFIQPVCTTQNNSEVDKPSLGDEEAIPKLKLTSNSRDLVLLHPSHSRQKWHELSYGAKVKRQ